LWWGCSFHTPLSLVSLVSAMRMNANVSTTDVCFQLLLQANNIPAITDEDVDVDVPASNSDQNQEIQPVSTLRAQLAVEVSIQSRLHSSSDKNGTPWRNT
jgi:hypothetical protein